MVYKLVSKYGTCDTEFAGDDFTARASPNQFPL